MKSECKTTKKLQKVIEEVDWKKLEDHLSSLLKNPVNLTIEVKQYRRPCLHIESGELAQHSGIMALAYDTLKIVNFGSFYDEEKRTLAISLDFRWEFKKGGSNGYTFLNAFYEMTTSTWTFK